MFKKYDINQNIMATVRPMFGDSYRLILIYLSD